MRLKSALRRGVAAAVIAGIVVSSGIPAYAGTWDIADGNITVRADEAEGTNNVKQGDNDFVKDEGDTVITGESKENTVTIDTSEGDVDVTFDDLKIDVSGKKEGNGSDDSPVRESKAAVTVQGDHDATIELDGKNELKSGSYNAGLEKNEHEAEGTLTIKDDKGKDGSLTAEGGDNGGAGIGGGMESTGSNIKITGGTIEAVGGEGAAGIGGGELAAQGLRVHLAAVGGYQPAAGKVQPGGEHRKIQHRTQQGEHRRAEPCRQPEPPLALHLPADAGGLAQKCLLHQQYSQQRAEHGNDERQLIQRRIILLQ